jgi:hypothetical protein
MMENYLIQVTPSVENINPMIDPNLKHATLEPETLEPVVD